MIPTLKVLIVDDEPNARDGLERILLACQPAIQIIGKAENAQNALEIINDTQPDIVFLDIQMPVNSGFWLVEQLSKYHLPIAIVFVTAYDEYAIQALRYAAFDFLLKPIDTYQLQTTLNRFVGSNNLDLFHEKRESLQTYFQMDRIGVNTTNGFKVIGLGSIVHIETNNSFAHMYLFDGRCEMINLSLEELGHKLPSLKFVKINKSIIVNADFVESIDQRSKRVILSGVLQKYEFKATTEGVKKLLKMEL